MFKRTTRDSGVSMQKRSFSGYETSIIRCAIAALLIAVGIAWIATYVLAAEKHAMGILNTKGTGVVGTSLPWMSNLHNWNYLIGFGLVTLGLIVSAHRTTPLGRGRGVVVGMLFCFLFGLAWVVTYYMAVDSIRSIPIFKALNQYNLLVGVAFMAVGFSFATKWE